MNIAVFTVSTPEFDIDETVAFAKRIGCDGIEWRVSEPAPPTKPEGANFENRYWTYNRSTIDIHTVERELPRAAQKTRDAGMEAFAATTYLRAGRSPVEEIRRAIDAAGTAGASYMRTPVPGYDGSAPYPSLFDSTRKAIQQIVPFAETAGIRVCFEMHMNTIMPSASSARRLLDGFPSDRIGVIYDPGNLVIEGYEDYKMGLEILGDYLAYVHVKNARWVRGTESGAWKWEWAPFADGMADFERVVAALRAVGYDGWLSIEDFDNNEPTEEKLTGVVAELKALTGAGAA